LAIIAEMTYGHWAVRPLTIQLPFVVRFPSPPPMNRRLQGQAGPSLTELAYSVAANGYTGDSTSAATVIRRSASERATTGVI